MLHHWPKDCIPTQDNPDLYYHKSNRVVAPCFWKERSKRVINRRKLRIRTYRDQKKSSKTLSSFLFELKSVPVFYIIDPLKMRTSSLLVKFQPYSRLLLSTRKKCRRVFQYFGKIATPSKEVFGLKKTNDLIVV